VEGKGGLDQTAAAADLLDRQWLEHHDLAMELPENLDSFPVALVRVGRRHARVRYQTLPLVYRLIPVLKLR